MDDGSEEVLTGGHTSAVTRVGATVHRSTGRWTTSVHGLLRHLEAVNFEGAPRVVGFDAQDREVLSYLPGKVPGEAPWPDYVWSEVTLADVGHWLSRYHRAVRAYRPRTDSRWWYHDGAPREGEIICHNDVGPYNTVFVAGRMAGIIDWDVAGPAKPLWDLAFCAWSWVPLHHPRLTRVLGGPAEAAQSSRLKILCSSHGHGDPAGLLSLVVERVVASRDGVLAGAEAGDSVMCRLVSEGHLADMELTLEYLHDRRAAILGDAS